MAWTGARVLSTSLYIAAAFALAGCSSSLFTEDKGQELDQAKGDGKVDKACLKLDFSKPTLDVQTTRSLVHCLNGNGSIQAYENLVGSLSDTQLQVVLDTMNAQLLNNPTRLKATDSSFEQMDERGILTRAFDKLSKILSKGKLIRSAVRLVRQTTTREGDGALFHSRPRNLDPDILNSIKILAQEVSRDSSGHFTVEEARKTAANGLEMGVRTTALDSYKAMIDGFHSQIPLRSPSLNLKFFTERTLEYIKAKIHGDRALGKVLMWGIADGSLLKAFDYYYYSECEKLTPGKCDPTSGGALALDSQTQAMEAFMRLLSLEHKEDILSPMVKLFRVMDAPISCMADTKQVPNADMFVMNELIKLVPLDVPQWTMRTNTMKMKLVNSMCEFPNDDEVTFNTLMNVLRELSRYTDANSFGRPLITVSHFLKGLEVGDQVPMSAGARADLARYMDYPENERHRRFMTHWLGDKNESVNAYTHLADLLGELSRPNRQVVGNLLYLLNVAAPGSKDRADIQSMARTFMSSQSLLGGRSLYDIFNNAILKVDVGTLYDLLTGVSELIDLQEDLANPLLDVNRDALLMNNSNPVIEIALDLGLNADKNQLFFETLFEIADTDQFEDAMLLTARMADNGTLRELLKGLLMMFRGHTGDIAPPIPQNVPPAKLADPSRDQSTRNRPAWKPDPAWWPQDYDRVQGCYDINLDLPFGNPFPGETAGRSTWERQMGQIASCVNANHGNAEAESFLNYGVSQKVKDDRSFLGTVVDLMADFIPTGGERARLQNIYDELSDLMLDDASFRDMKTMNEMLPLLFEKKYCSTKYSDEAPRCQANAPYLSVMQGLSRAMTVVAGEGTRLQDILNVGKIAVVDKQLPKSVGLLYDVSNDAEERADNPDKYPFVADKKPPISSYPTHGGGNTNVEKWLAQAIEKYEGRKATPEIIAQKVEQYYNQPLPAEELYYTDYKGVKRSGYANAEIFKEKIKPLFDELSKGNRVEATMTFFYRMYGNPYTPEWWSYWFRYLASNVRAVPYYYPGQYPGKSKPTVRLISQLEMLDLVVANADFTLSQYGQDGFGIVGNDDNFAIKYLTLLGLCGEDMDPAVDRMGRELAFFQSMSERLGGIPVIGGKIFKDELRRRLFNLTQIFPILREVNKVYKFEGSDGKVIYANHLGVLRDLFKAVLKALPEDMHDERKNKELYRRDKNPLALIAEMVRFGILRNIGVNMWYVNPDARNPMKLQHSDDTDRENRKIVPQKISHILRFLMDAAVKRDAQKFTLNRDAVAILRYLTTDNCDRKSKPEYSNLPCVVPAGKKDPRSFNERYMLIGRVLDQFFDWIKDDDRREYEGKTRVMAMIKRSGYDAMRLIERLGGDNLAKRTEFTQQLTKVLRPVLGSAKGAELITENMDLVEPLFNDSESLHFINLLIDAETSDRMRDDTAYTDSEAFADFKGLAHVLMTELSKQDAFVATEGLDLAYLLYSDPQSRFKSAFNAMKWMKDDPEYISFKKANGERITRQIVRWFGREGTASQPRELRPRLQEHLGEHLGNGDVKDLMLFIGNQSSTDQFYNQIKFVGNRDYVNKLNDFLELMKGGIVDVYPRRQATQ